MAAFAPVTFEFVEQLANVLGVRELGEWAVPLALAATPLPEGWAFRTVREGEDDAQRVVFIEPGQTEPQDDHPWLRNARRVLQRIRRWPAPASGKMLGPFEDLNSPGTEYFFVNLETRERQSDIEVPPSAAVPPLPEDVKEDLLAPEPAERPPRTPGEDSRGGLSDEEWEEDEAAAKEAARQARIAAILAEDDEPAGSGGDGAAAAASAAGQGQGGEAPGAAAAALEGGAGSGGSRGEPQARPASSPAGEDAGPPLQRGGSGGEGPASGGGAGGAGYGGVGAVSTLARYGSVASGGGGGGGGGSQQASRTASLKHSGSRAAGAAGAGPAGPRTPPPAQPPAASRGASATGSRGDGDTVLYGSVANTTSSRTASAYGRQNAAAAGATASSSAAAASGAGRGASRQGTAASRGRGGSEEGESGASSSRGSSAASSSNESGLSGSSGGGSGGRGPVPPANGRLAFFGWWWEDIESTDLSRRIDTRGTAGGGLAPRHCTLTYDFATESYTFAVRDPVTPPAPGQPLERVGALSLRGLPPDEVVVAESGRPAGVWDLHLGARLRVLGRTLVLKNAERATAEWHTRYCRQLTALRDALSQEVQKYKPRQLRPGLVMDKGAVSLLAGRQLRHMAVQVAELVEELRRYRPAKADAFQAALPVVV